MQIASPTTPTPMANPRRSSLTFLSLPLELRRQIYRYLLLATTKEPGVLQVLFRCQRAGPKPDDNDDGEDVDNPGRHAWLCSSSALLVEPRPTELSFGPANLGLTCRALHAEFLPLVYSRVHFYISFCNDVYTSPNDWFGDTVPGARLADICDARLVCRASIRWDGFPAAGMVQSFMEDVDWGRTWCWFSMLQDPCVNNDDILAAGPNAGALVDIWKRVQARVRLIMLRRNHDTLRHLCEPLSDVILPAVVLWILMSGPQVQEDARYERVMATAESSKSGPQAGLWDDI